MRRFSIIAFFIFSLFIAQLKVRGETVYFFVGNMIGNVDGYVLPLSDPMDIYMARELIKHRFGPPLVVARISHDVDGININRNYYADPAPSWSWYVTEFLGFADATIELLDGYPTMVENGTFAGNIIGFWTYTVKAELGTELNPWCEVLKPDCAVDINDLQIFTNHFLDEDCEYPGWCTSADLNVSGSVDFLDLALLANKWCEIN